MSTFGACVTSKCGAGPFLTVLIIICGKQQMTDLFLLSERYPAHQSVESWGPNKIHLRCMTSTFHGLDFVQA